MGVGVSFSHAEKGEGVGGLTHTEWGGGGGTSKVLPLQKKGVIFTLYLEVLAILKVGGGGGVTLTNIFTLS